MTETADVVEPVDRNDWATVAEQLDETMRQRLIEFGKAII
jgi:hypothetical protein